MPFTTGTRLGPYEIVSPLGARQLIAIRLDARVLDEFRKEARRRRVGYQTLISDVLAQHIRKDVA